MIVLMFSFQYGPPSVKGDGGVGTASRKEPQNSGTHSHLEHRDPVDALRVRHGRIRDRRVSCGLLATGELMYTSRCMIEAVFKSRILDPIPATVRGLVI